MTLARHSDITQTPSFLSQIKTKDNFSCIPYIMFLLLYVNTCTTTVVWSSQLHFSTAVVLIALLNKTATSNLAIFSEVFLISQVSKGGNALLTSSLGFLLTWCVSNKRSRKRRRKKGTDPVKTHVSTAVR